jgi:23S rRNA (pseudouridine1915-N3)-methyltransferase
MEVALLAVGRLRPYYREACDDYARRLARHVRFSEVEVRETARLAGRVPPGAVLVCLARDGTAWTSEALAARMDAWRTAARPVVFMIGGSHGLDDALLRQAAHRWSLGPLTLPHELARVVVLEQLYRAFTILRGEPYHKGR